MISRDEAYTEYLLAQYVYFSRKRVMRAIKMIANSDMKEEEKTRLIRSLLWKVGIKELPLEVKKIMVESILDRI